MITLTLDRRILRLENRSENRSHRNEMPGNGDIQKIKEDMKLFLHKRGN